MRVRVSARVAASSNGARTDARAGAATAGARANGARAGAQRPPAERASKQLIDPPVPRTAGRQCVRCTLAHMRPPSPYITPFTHVPPHCGIAHSRYVGAAHGREGVRARSCSRVAQWRRLPPRGGDVRMLPLAATTLPLATLARTSAAWLRPPPSSSSILRLACSTCRAQARGRRIRALTTRRSGRRRRTRNRRARRRRRRPTGRGCQGGPSGPAWSPPCPCQWPTPRCPRQQPC